MDRKQEISVDFEVNEDMVGAFARLTGDYNSMHVNPEVLRKPKHKRPVVHGMIPFSFLQIIQLDFPEQHVLFEKFSTRFTRPVFTGDKIHLAISYGTQNVEWMFEAT